MTKTKLTPRQREVLGWLNEVFTFTPQMRSERMISAKEIAELSDAGLAEVKIDLLQITPAGRAALEDD